MIQMKRHYVTPNVPFSLGRVGEHHAHEIVFDLRRWKNLYGEGEAQLMARRSGETAMYPVPLTVEGDSAIWRVAKTDNAISGDDGECELRYLLPDGAVAKSETWAVSVQPSMNYEESEPPVEARPWMDTLNEHIANVLELESGVEENANKAEEFASRAESSADRIENMGVDAVALTPGSAATVKKLTDGDVVRLVFGLPEGKAGYTPQKGVDYFDGADGIPATHSWDGTKLVITSASGTSSVDLKGERGESGVITPLNGFFTLSVDADGNLWAHSAEEGTPLSFEYDGETGDLYIVQEV